VGRVACGVEGFQEARQKVDADIVQAMLRAVELKDLSTAAHTWRVVLYMRSMAQESVIPLPTSSLQNGKVFDSGEIAVPTIERVVTGAALHDIGKIQVPAQILRKVGALDPSERAIMERHAALGHEQLQLMGETDPIILGMVRSHHERVDGLGYPDGLKGSAIPIAARLLAVVDTFDAMTSVRSYRRELGEEAAKQAIEHLWQASGTRYDADCVERFASLYSQGGLEWVLHYYNDEIPVEGFNHNEGLEVLVREGGEGFRAWRDRQRV
jgi:HD-GYP domain-containing protein (c-di-GMP phosphodiesterase class II)